jgi:CRISPR/Cas system-associated exonuclease Cas4 (RecB family)
MDFAVCQHRAKLLYIDKVKPQNQTPNPYYVKGQEIHKLIETYLSTPDVLFPDEPILKPWQEELEKLKAQGAKPEEPFAFDSSWTPCAWDSDTVWLRAKVDCLVLDPPFATVIDFKTGGRLGIKHVEQERLYQLIVFLKYPEVQEITTEFWYLKTKDKCKAYYTRDQGLAYLDYFTKQATIYTNTYNFKPNPNIFTCSKCSVKEVCIYAVPTPKNIRKLF